MSRKLQNIDRGQYGPIRWPMVRHLLAMLGAIGLALCLVAVLMIAIRAPALPALAQPSAATITFSPSPATIQTCAVVPVQVMINDVANLYGAEVDVAFDPNVLQVVDADSIKNGVQVLDGNLFPAPYVLFNTADNAKGTITYVSFQLNPALPITGSGAFYTVSFTARANGTSPLTFTLATLSDRNGNSIAGTPVNGSVASTGLNTVTLVANPISQTVGSSSVLTATVADILGDPVTDGTIITFTADLGSVLSPRTTSQGIATSVISSVITGTSHIVATDGCAQGATSVLFTPGSALAIDLQANPVLLVADGVSTATITATITDQFNHPIADGTTVNFSAALGSVGTPRTTANGRAVTTFTAGTQAGTAIVTATVDDYSNSIGLALIQGQADLSSSTKLASADIISAGGRLTYTIFLTNSGNSLATGVALTDAIPISTTYLPGSLSGSGAAYNSSQNRIEWSGSVPPAGVVTVRYAVTVNATGFTAIVNRAYVSINHVLDRILTVETQVTPSAAPPQHIYLPLIRRNS